MINNNNVAQRLWTLGAHSQERILFMRFQNIPNHFPEVQLSLIEPGYHCCNTRLNNIKDVYTFMKDILRNRNTECVYIINLSNDFKPINYALVGKGNASKSSFNIPDIVKICLLSNATNCILVHNHLSSGKPNPSETDDNTAQCLIRILKTMQIHLCDFVITSPDSIYSYLTEHRTPYNEEYSLYDKHMPYPDSPYVTLTKKTNLSYAQKLSQQD